MDIKEKILLALGLEREKEVKLGWQSKTEDGTILVSTAEELENGVDISVLTEDGTTILLPPGSYKTDTGLTIIIEEEGIVAEVIESETEEDDTVEEEMTEDLAEEDKEDYEEEDDDRKEEADVADWKGMEKRIQNLEDAVADLKRDKEGGDDEVEEMTEEVVEKPKSIKKTETVEFSVEDEINKLKEENEKLKTELAESPADSPINTNKFSADKVALSARDYKKLSKRERFLYNLNK